MTEDPNDNNNSTRSEVPVKPNAPKTDRLELRHLDKLDLYLGDPESWCIREIYPDALRGLCEQFEEYKRRDDFVLCPLAFKGQNMVVAYGPMAPAPQMLYWPLIPEAIGRRATYGFVIGYFSKEAPSKTSDDFKSIPYVFPHGGLRMYPQHSFPEKKTSWGFFG